MPGQSGGLLRHHDDEGFLEALRLLIDSGRVSDPEALVKYAESAKEPHAAEHLRGLMEEGLPLQLIYDAFAVHLRIVAFKKNSGMFKDCVGKKVGLVLPLPPHVMENFLDLPELQVFVPDGHHLPPPMRHRKLSEVKGTRACRREISNLEVVVFEAHRSGGTFHLEESVADVVDPRIIPAAAKFFVHLRPHADPNDQPLTASQTISVL